MHSASADLAYATCHPAGQAGGLLADSELACIRAQFPIFSSLGDAAFLDNASTTQKPASVIEAIDLYYRRSCANAGRASYSMSTLAAQAIESSRQRLARFIKARPAEIAFTSGATESLNLIAWSWGLANLGDGDQVMVCLEDHASAVLPWFNLQRALARFGVNIEIVPFRVHDVGDYDLKDIAARLTNRTRVIQMAHIHHLYGMDMEVADVREIVGPGVVISLDASQSVGHVLVDVEVLDVDFISFSAHKMFAATGLGVLWVSPRLAGQVAPAKLGGKGAGTIDAGKLAIDGRATAELFEAGSQNIPAIMSLVPAIDFIESIGLAKIGAHLSALTRYAYDGLRTIPGIEFAPGPGRCGCPGGYGIISFRLADVPSVDLGFVLDSEGVFVRAGDHCVGRPADGEDYVRVSMHVYNSVNEIDRLVETIRSCLA